jgi:hypothetical protein
MQFPSSMKEFLSLSIYPREADSETCRLILSLVVDQSRRSLVLPHHRLCPLQIVTMHADLLARRAHHNSGHFPC